MYAELSGRLFLFFPNYKTQIALISRSNLDITTSQPEKGRNKGAPLKETKFDSLGWSCNHCSSLGSSEAHGALSIPCKETVVLHLSDCNTPLPKKSLIDFYGLKDLQPIVWRYQRRANERVRERDIYIVLSQAAGILFLDNVELLSKGISLGVIA